MDINTLTMEQFKNLPLVVEGESKEVRYAGNGKVVIRLKPTIYSYTHNRTGIIARSDTVRLKAIQQLLPVLTSAGIQHSYLQVTEKWVLSTLVLQPATTHDQTPFRPVDLSENEISKLPVAPPVEVVVKAVHSGTPKHRYYHFGEYPTRTTNAPIPPESPYPSPFVRFDWRNPMYDNTGERLADEVMPEPMADWYINVRAASKTALTAFQSLRVHLSSKGLDLWDICFFISQDGKTMFGEVSPDCLRVRALNGEALDKDVWRAGGSSPHVLDKWQAFVDHLDSKPVAEAIPPKDHAKGAKI